MTLRTFAPTVEYRCRFGDLSGEPLEPAVSGWTQCVNSLFYLTMFVSYWFHSASSSKPLPYWVSGYAVPGE